MRSVEQLHFEAVQAMDRELAVLARAAGRLRFRLGVGLEALARCGGHHELGFSSVEAYALERCERSARWVQEACWLARRLGGLPKVRAAVEAGEISFSMALVVARCASAEDEVAWLGEARTRTVRQMRMFAANREGNGSKWAGVESHGADEGDEEFFATAREEFVTLIVSADLEDAWLFEATQTMARQLSGVSAGEVMEALLAEGTTSLLARVGREGFAPFDDSADELAQRRWVAELARWRDEAEARCEGSFRVAASGSANGGEIVGGRQVAGAGAARCVGESDPACDVADAVVAGDAGEGNAGGGKGELVGTRELVSTEDAIAIDAELRTMARELSKRDVELGRLAEDFWQADGWRRLGYATAAQYARERLGASLSSIKAKRGLARRAERLPQIGVALGKGELGYEAGRLVASVATPDTADEWIARAGERTVRFLREEVDAVKMFARLDPGSVASPPSEEIMRALAAVESRIVSGSVFRAVDAGMAGGIAVAGLDGQMSAGEVEPRGACIPRRRGTFAERHAGRVKLRFRVLASVRRYYRWLETLFQRRGPTGMSFVRFLCCAFAGAWGVAPPSNAALASVYRRDRYRCLSPVCGRRGVTPHHLRFRSAGGGDGAENIASLCVWCHLEGVHGGRLRANPPASDIAWTIGRTGHTVVRGRRRVRMRAPTRGSARANERGGLEP